MMHEYGYGLSCHLSIILRCDYFKQTVLDLDRVYRTFACISSSLEIVMPPLACAENPYEFSAWLQLYGDTSQSLPYCPFRFLFKLQALKIIDLHHLEKLIHMKDWTPFFRKIIVSRSSEKKRNNSRFGAFSHFASHLIHHTSLHATSPRHISQDVHQTNQRCFLSSRAPFASSPR
jgi:hypothetical protein